MLNAGMFWSGIYDHLQIAKPQAPNLFMFFTNAVSWSVVRVDLNFRPELNSPIYIGM
jgi:hypothetical protein